MLTIRKGQPMVILIFLLGLFIIGFAWVILSNPVGQLYEKYRLDPNIANVQSFQNFYKITRSIWLWMPFVGVIGLTFWAITEAHRKDDTFG